jgi:hypothetical protein
MLFITALAEIAIEDTFIEETFKLHPPELQLGFLKFLRGTPMRKKADSHGYKYDPLPPYQIIESNYLNPDELHKITLLEEALEIYWNKKRAINTLKYISKRSSIFDFLCGLGSYFQSQKDFHNHTLHNVYDILFDYVSANYNDDKIVKELVAIDYYSQSKVKPQQRYLLEIDQSERIKLIDRLKLNHHKYRYIILPVTFNVNSYLAENTITPSTDFLILQYNGKAKPEVLNLLSEFIEQ